MTTAPTAATARHFQFRIATLLVVMVWVGLISLGLKAPTPIYSGLLAIVTLLGFLCAILVVSYRANRVRAAAIGFIVFCAGYYGYAISLSPAFSSPFDDDSTLSFLFHVIHPDDETPLRVGGTMLSPPPYRVEHFIAICHHAIATLLGILGAIIAQILYATRKPETAQ